MQEMILLKFLDAASKAMFGVYTDQWYMDYKLWLGFALMCLYYVAYVAQSKSHAYSGRWIEIVGLNLIILHIIQYSTLGIEKELAISVGMVHFAVNSTYTALRSKSVVPEFTAANLYQDFQTHLGKVCSVFLGQLFLTYLYQASLMKLDIRSDNVSYGYWLGSIVAVQMASMFGRGADSSMGRAFHGALWAFLLRDFSQLTVAKEITGKEPKPMSISRSTLVARCAMAFVINEVLRSVVAMSTPLILMTSETPMDFLQNCLAVAFIFQLDDTGSGGTYIVTKEGASAEEARALRNS